MINLHEETFSISSVCGSALVLRKIECIFEAGADEELEALFNLVNIIGSPRDINYCPLTKRMVWDHFTYDFSDLSRIKGCRGENIAIKSSVDPDSTIFPHLRRQIKEFLGCQQVHHASFTSIVTIDQVAIFDAADEKVFVFPDKTKFLQKIQDRYALLVIPQSEEKSNFCLIDVDSFDFKIHNLFSFDSHLIPSIKVLENNEVYITCDVWYRLLINYHQGVYLAQTVGHPDDIPVYCPVNGIEWIPSPLFLMERNESFKLSKFKQLEGCILS